MILGFPKRIQNRSQNRCQKLFDFGPSWAPILGDFWPPGGCNIASRAPKMAPRRPRERPRRALYASRTAPAPPKTPPGPPPAHPRHPQGSPRASKTALYDSKSSPRALQESFLKPQAAAKSYLEELSKLPATALQPPTSGLQVASAGCAKR